MRNELQTQASYSSCTEIRGMYTIFGKEAEIYLCYLKVGAGAVFSLYICIQTAMQIVRH